MEQGSQIGKKITPDISKFQTTNSHGNIHLNDLEDNIHLNDLAETLQNEDVPSWMKIENNNKGFNHHYEALTRELKTLRKWQVENPCAQYNWRLSKYLRAQSIKAVLNKFPEVAEKNASILRDLDWKIKKAGQ